MDQLHKRFTDQQIKVLFQGYCQGVLRRAEVQEMLSIGKTRFFTFQVLLTLDSVEGCGAGKGLVSTWLRVLLKRGVAKRRRWWYNS